MKIFLLLVVAGALWAQAQADSATPETNAAQPALLNLSTNSPPRTNAPPKPPTEIFSDSGEFDLKSRVAVYIGNVRVIDPQMKMLCELLTVIVPEGGGRIDHITAETNVVIDAVDSDGNPIHATGQKAVYTYKVENSVTNELMELTGGPYVESKAVSGSGEKIVWDRVKNSIRVYKQTHVIIQQPPDKEPGTNAPAPEPEKKPRE